MSVGDNRHYVVDRILPKHFVQSADAAGMPCPCAMRQIFDELIETVPGAITTHDGQPALRATDSCIRRAALSAASRNGSISWRGPADQDDELEGTTAPRQASATSGRSLVRLDGGCWSLLLPDSEVGRVTVHGRHLTGPSGTGSDRAPTDSARRARSPHT